MNVIDSAGNYAYVPGTKTLVDSDHPAQRARIELALELGTWLYAPTSGRKFARFNKMKQSEANIQEFQKEVEKYLENYNEEVIDIFVARAGITMDLEIAKEVTDVLL